MFSFLLFSPQIYNMDLRDHLRPYPRHMLSPFLNKTFWVVGNVNKELATECKLMHCFLYLRNFCYVAKKKKKVNYSILCVSIIIAFFRNYRNQYGEQSKENCLYLDQKTDMIYDKEHTWAWNYDFLPFVNLLFYLNNRQRDEGNVHG